MSALVLVRDTRGTPSPRATAFTLGPVPPGSYACTPGTSAPSLTRPLEVTADGVEQLAVELDARGFQFKPHLNKHGQPYPQQGPALPTGESSRRAMKLPSADASSSAPRSSSRCSGSAPGNQAAGRRGGGRRLGARLGATASSIEEALASRSLTLLRLTQALVQVPAYVSRIGESLRAGDRANLLDQADELRVQTGADWVLVTDGARACCRHGPRGGASSAKTSPAAH